MKIKTHLQLMAPDSMSQGDIRLLCTQIWYKSFELENAALHATMEDGVIDPKHQIYMIMAEGALGTQFVIGLTGFFEPVGSVVYLRWTGVHPQYRRSGVFRQAITELTQILKGANPSLNTLVELVPDNEYGRSIAGAFTALGFAPDPNFGDIIEGEDDNWDVIPYVLKF